MNRFVTPVSLTRRTIVVAIAGSLVAGCSGGTSQLSAPAGVTPAQPPGTAAKARTGNVKATILVPHGTSGRTKSGQRRAYISPATLGLIIVVTQTTPGGTSTYSTTGYDLTSESTTTNCTPVAGGTSCVLYFNAPPTGNGNSDAFSLYAYDQPQSANTIASPAGNELSQDISDAVPGQANNTSGITSGVDNVLTFALSPVVANVAANLLGTQSNIVLSVSGAGGTSNTVAIDGYDADGNEIAAYPGTSGAGLYANPIQLTPADDHVEPQLPYLSNPAADTVAFTYDGAASTKPSAGSTAYSAAISASDSFPGGYLGSSPYDRSGATITVAPLYGVIESTGQSGGNAVATIGAVQYAIPTGATANSYTLSNSNNCPDYVINQSAVQSGSIQSVFAVTEEQGSLACTFALSDGISITPVTLNGYNP